MEFLFLVVFLSLFCSICECSDKQVDDITLEASVNLLEDQLRRQGLISNIYSDDQEKMDFGNDNVIPRDCACSEEIIKDLVDFKAEISQNVEQLAQELGDEKIKAEKMSLLLASGNDSRACQKRLDEFEEKFEDNTDALKHELRAEFLKEVEKLNELIADDNAQSTKAKEELTKVINGQNRVFEALRQEFDIHMDKYDSDKALNIREVNDMFEIVGTLNETVGRVHKETILKNTVLDTEMNQLKKTTANIMEIQKKQADSIETMGERISTLTDKYDRIVKSYRNLGKLIAFSLEADRKMDTSLIKLRNDMFWELEVFFEKEPLQQSTLAPSKRTVVTKEPDVSDPLKTTTDATTTTETPQHVPKPECQAGWILLGNQCYLFLDNWREFKSWENASLDCQTRGGKLAEPLTEEMHDDIASIIADSFYGVWLGGIGKRGDAFWVWNRSKQPIGYDKWFPGEPNSKFGEYTCLYLYKKMWRDSPCAWTFPYLCEKLPNY